MAAHRRAATFGPTVCANDLRLLVRAVPAANRIVRNLKDELIWPHVIKRALKRLKEVRVVQVGSAMMKKRCIEPSGASEHPQSAMHQVHLKATL